MSVGLWTQNRTQLAVFRDRMVCVKLQHTLHDFLSFQRLRVHQEFVAFGRDEISLGDDLFEDMMHAGAEQSDLFADIGRRFPVDHQDPPFQAACGVDDIVEENPLQRPPALLMADVRNRRQRIHLAVDRQRCAGHQQVHRLLFRAGDANHTAFLAILPAGEAGEDGLHCAALAAKGGRAASAG
ncbi:MAG: hypothetical protein NTY01_25800 [Verrucomicrobia bacterium]|nr:hypothetical protein [Verrucomicrobiota bacterium]